LENSGSDVVVYERPLTKAQSRALRRAEKKKAAQHSSAPPLVAKTERQAEYIELLEAGDSVFAVGGAGTGKTYIAARIAARLLRERKIDRIVVARATVSKPKHKVGYLPGNLEAKLKPWMIPVMDGLRAEVSANTIDLWRQEEKFAFLPFEQMRGRTISDAFIILDEAQNCDFEDLSMFLSRTGEGSQVVVTGDVDQVDIPDSGLREWLEIVEDDLAIPMEIVQFGVEDVVRSPLAKAIVRAIARRNATRRVKNLDELPDFIHNGRK
jgi:phosphate starvation-inducible PhoH-like protein